MVAAKGAWMMRDMARWAARYGVPLKMPPNFPLNTLNFMRGAVALEGDAVTFDRALSLGHKIAARAIREGETILKYNFPIGVATADIQLTDVVV